MPMMCASEVKMRTISVWWTIFNDPVLNKLVETAYGQNLTLREAGFRVLKNRAMLTGTIGKFSRKRRT